MGRRIWLSLTLALAAGCSLGSYTPNPGGPGDPNDPNDPNTTTSGVTGVQYFAAQVLPILQSKCATCHAGQQTVGPGFLGPKEESYYPALKGDTRFTGSADTSLLLTKGAHEGPALDMAEAATMRQWLTLELKPAMPSSGVDASPGPGPTTRTLSEALTLFGRCMSLTDFNDSGMKNVVNQTTNQGPCTSCHSQGMGGNWMSLNGDDTFNHMKLTPYIYRLVTGTINTDGSFGDLVPSNRIRDKGQENTTQHPQYILSDTRKAAVDNFVSKTMTRYKTGTCP